MEQHTKPRTQQRVNSGRQPPFAPRAGISCVLLAYNEELNVADAVASLSLISDDIWVVDSESTDQTREVAERAGASVVVHPWPGFARQRNWAVEHLPLKHQYVMMLDCDERIDEEFAREVQEILDRPRPPDLMRTRWRYWWLGRPVVHGYFGKSYKTTIGRRELLRWEREISEHVPPQGVVYDVKTPFEHRDAKDVRSWVLKHIEYARIEATHRVRRREASGNGRLVGGGQAARVAWLRENVYERLPATIRPLSYFAYRYLLGAGWRDGLTGTYFHFLQALWYPVLIDIFEYELRRGESAGGQDESELRGR